MRERKKYAYTKKKTNVRIYDKAHTTESESGIVSVFDAALVEIV